MNFEPTDDQDQFRASVERFAGPFDIVRQRALREADGGYPRERWAGLADLGLLALAVDAERGGLGGSIGDLAVVAGALGRAIAPDPWLENGFLPLALAPDLDGLGTGARIAALAFAEPGRRYELAPLTVTVDAGGKVNGRKTAILGGVMADVLLVTALGPGGFALVAIDRDAPGVTCQSYRVVDGSLASEIVLHDAQGVVLDGDAAGFATVVARGRLLAAAEMLGAGQRLFDDTLAYVKQREQFGVAIGSFQAIQHRLVECYARLEQARSHILRATLTESGSAPGFAQAAAGAKAYVGEAARHVGEEAIQLHGGMGQTDELAVGHAFKRIMLLDRLFGDQAQCRREYALAA
jgi:alkylation response protein AidB-like acyl-CoA dehydrogenase